MYRYSYSSVFTQLPKKHLANASWLSSATCINADGCALTLEIASKLIDMSNMYRYSYSSVFTQLSKKHLANASWLSSATCINADVCALTLEIAK